MRKLILMLCCATVFAACNKPKEEAAAVAEEPKPTPPTELADMKYADIGKQGLDALSSGNVDGWLQAYADNAKFYWSGGDSVVGKDKITAYWKDRRSNVIDSITFVNDIWLPIKINKPQKGPDREGVWLVSWFFANIKYKNGEKVHMWIHQDYHFDANDKIDQVVQYVDRAPINAALAKKKK
jgi:hypothetical protein